MARQKHDWTALKAEYLQSDTKDVTVWIKQKLSLPDNKRIDGNISDHVLGWAIDWEENRRQIAEEAIAQTRRELSNEMAEGLVAIQRVVSRIAREAAEEKRTLNVKDLGRLWEILMTENGRPTKIARNLISMPDDPFDSFDKLRVNDRRTAPESTDEVQDTPAG